MGLIGNGSVNKRCVVNAVSGNPRGGVNNDLLTSAVKNRFTTFNSKNGTPNGYLAPVSWVLPKTAGGLGSNLQLTGTLSNSFELAAGYPVSSSLTGTLSASPELTGLLFLTASASAAGEISDAAISWVAQLVSSLEASGAITDADVYILAAVFCSADLAALGVFSDANTTALSNALAALSASGTLTGDQFSTFSLEADLASFTELSPKNLADAVWAALASEHNNTGSMGEFVQKLLTVAKFLGLK